MKKVDSGGGWHSLAYTFRKAREVGPVRLARAMASRNACKTCALGMGGQKGGMRNESGHFPEVCKKSLQAMAADMQGRIEDRFFATYSIAQLQTLSPRELETSGRLVTPMIARPGDTHYRPATWDEALDIIGAELAATDPERCFFYASGRSSNEAGFLLNLLARAKGCNHVNNCSYYCHQASGVGLTQSLGSSTATIELADLDHCDTVFLIGGNPASNHPRLMTKLAEVRERGGHVVVVNPLKETGLVRFKIPSKAKSLFFGSDIASHYLQPRIGGDVSLLAGIVKWLVEHDKTADLFIADHTQGFAETRALVEGLTWEQIEADSGVPRKEIEVVAELYSRSHGTVFAWTMGITHHLHGVENVRWIVNTALARGMVGKPGAGLLPIRGHSNVQGLGTIGVTPSMTQAVLDGLQSVGVRPGDHAGMDTLDCLEAALAGRMDFALCLGGNLFGASPESSFAASALAGIKTVVYLSTTLNTGHAHGLGQTTIILPVLARDEDVESTTQESMFSFVRLSDGGKPRHTGPKSEVDVLTEVADRACSSHGVLVWSRLKSHDEIRSLIARFVPSLENVKDIGATKKEFSIPGRVLHSPKFSTPDSRAKFSACWAKPVETKDGELLMMTIRSEGQFNTVVYEEEDTYRGQERRDIVLMNANDMERLGLHAQQRVSVWNVTGKSGPVLVRPFDIAPGCVAMYCPEANVLVPRAADPQSKTPAFKAVPVCVKLL